ncbi:hypothetical protein FOL47_008489 [Perkinsus chesapeaki]|uniref:Uncharacterized protein n=1 Tax=Perkinsus chesapeaki TaxID=330153 RepID=A0A7J6LDH8_PERCH|nr:hypothetical protein FOL47_008489 [Perkinsus chesapeaki]
MREVAALMASLVSHKDNASQMRFTCGLETIVEGHQKEIDDIAHKLEEEKLHRQSREEEIELLKNRLSEVEVENRKLKDNHDRRSSGSHIDVARLATTLEDIKTDRKIMDKQLAKIGQRAATLEDEKTEWLGHRDELLNLVDELKKENKSLKDFAEDREALRRRLADAEDTAEDLLVQLTELRSENSKLREESEGVREQLAKLMQQFVDYSASGNCCVGCEELKMRSEDILAYSNRARSDAKPSVSSNSLIPSPALLSEKSSTDFELDSIAAERDALTLLSTRLKEELCSAIQDREEACAKLQDYGSDRVLVNTATATYEKEEASSDLSEKLVLLEAENEELRAECRTSRKMVEMLKLDLVDARNLSASLNNQLLHSERMASTIGSGSPMSQAPLSPTDLGGRCSYGFSEVTEESPLTPQRPGRRRGSSGGLYGLLARATGQSPHSRTKQVDELQRIARELTIQVEEKEETIHNLRRLLSEHKDFLVSEAPPDVTQRDCRADTI